MDNPDNYQGPGIYQHYKGGIYVVVGLVRMEWCERLSVLYMTTDPEHREDQFYRGLFGTVRPLNLEDGPDCWNSIVDTEGGSVPRFVKVG